MSVPILSARDLTRSYGQGESRFDALRGISLDVREGESLAIVGKSGSGKSTLMHLLALLDRPTSGEIELSGRSAARLPASRLNRLRNETFGFVFQQFFLTPNTTVLDNVTLPLRIAGVGPAERRRRGMAVLERLDIAEKAGSRATDMSGGQKQRVCIARALVNEPDVIFADEPTGNLDSTTGETVENILLELNRLHGITLIVVTHDEDLAARLDRSVHIHDGRITGTTAAAPGQAPGQSAGVGA